MNDANETFVVQFSGSSNLHAQKTDLDSEKIKAVDVLDKRQIRCKVETSSILGGANVIGGHFILTLKSVCTSEKTAKERYTAQNTQVKKTSTYPMTRLPCACFDPTYSVTCSHFGDAHIFTQRILSLSTVI